MIPMFEAADGQKFDSSQACIDHEVALLDQLLASLNPELIRESLKRGGIAIRADRSVSTRGRARKGVIQSVEQKQTAAEARQ